MTDTYVRTTVHVVVLPDDERIAAVRIKRAYSDSFFRPDRITETVTETSAARGDGYTVKVAGPVITPKGKDHASQRGDRTYGDWSGNPVDGVPEEIKPFLAGRGALVAHVFSGPEDGR